MYKFETSLAFPLLKINSLIRFTKVKKPSGISYFLLTLINEGLNKKSKISDLLKEFGVPEELHELFSDELLLLVTHDILTPSIMFNQAYFPAYTLEHFKLSEKGKKVFREEAIPLDYNEEIKQSVFYNPANNQFSTTLVEQYGKNDNSFLTDDFYKRFNTPDEDLLEEYFNAIKGNGIPIKKEEVILNTDIQGIELYQFKCPMRILLFEDDRIDFEFDDVRYKEFFEKYYDRHFISNGLMFKNKFKFDNKVAINTMISNEQSLKKIMFAEDIKKVTSLKAFLDITDTDYQIKNSKLFFVNKKILGDIHRGASIIKIYNINDASVYIPAIISTKNQRFGEFNLNFLIEKKLSKEKIREIIINLIINFNDFIEDTQQSLSFDNLVLLSKFIKDNDFLKQKVRSWLKFDLESNINLLKKMRDKLLDDSQMLDFVNNLGMEYLENYLRNLTLKNLPSKINTCRWIIAANKLSDIKILEIVFNDQNVVDSNKIELFDLLESLNFSHNDIFMFMKDIVPILLNKNNSKSRLANTINQAMEQLDALKKITNIFDPNNYTVSYDFDSDKFIKTYSRFIDLFDELLVMKKHASDIYNSIDEFKKIFSELFNIITIEKNALKDPKKINEKLIDNKINSGDVVSAVSYMYAKFSDITKSIFKIDKDFSKMINTLNQRELISIEDAKLLHDFRNYRNSLTHANKKGFLLNIEDLKKVKKLIFNLERGKK